MRAVPEKKSLGLCAQEERAERVEEVDRLERVEDRVERVWIVECRE